nr:ComEC/Rec2 family competence protein [Micromonospora sp. NBRC 107566]
MRRFTSREDGATAPPEAPDLRLAGPAVAAWLSALAAIHGTAPTAALVALGATVGAVLTAAAPTLAAGRARGWFRSAGRMRWIVAGLLVGTACGTAATAARLVARDAPSLARLAHDGARVEAVFVLTGDPTRTRGSVGRPPSFVAPARLVRITADDPPSALSTSAGIVVLGSDPGWPGFLPGQRLAASGRLMPPRGGDLRAAALSVTGAPRPIGRAPWVQRAAGVLRAGLQRACAPLPDEPGGLLPGLVVGDVSRLDPAVRADFVTTGMTHLTAVSGSNVAIVLGAVLLLARWCRAGPRVAVVACAVALVGFVILARPSPSVVRAAAMGAVGLLALVSGRSRAALPALCATIMVLIVADPGLAVDAGFALSVLATGGLLLLGARWRDGLRRLGVPVGFAEALAIPAAAQVACAPVIAGLSGQVSIVALPANLLVAPAIAPATVLGVAAAAVSPVLPAGAAALAWLAGWPARWLVAVARYGAELPAGVLPWPAGVVGALLLGGVTVALLLAARRPVVRRLVAVVAAAAVVGALPVRWVASGWPPAGWIMVACDVGQGDAVVLPVGAGRAVVVDAGPEPAATDRCLRRLGVRAVPLLVVSHFHADHVGGVAGVFRGRRVAAVAVPAWPEPAGGRRAVQEQAAAQGAPISVPGAGWSYAAGPLSLTVLAPADVLRGTRSDPNNNSLVLRARVRGVDILLAGDAEEEEQRALLERYGAGPLRAPVLKVAHHGSAYQEPAFLDAVDPTVALVSVGLGNDYGHPNPSLLARLARGGARVLRTDRDGDVAVLFTERGIAIAERGASS